jgi:hypothetical protein
LDINEKLDKIISLLEEISCRLNRSNYVSPITPQTIPIRWEENDNFQKGPGDWPRGPEITCSNISEYSSNKAYITY